MLHRDLRAGCKLALTSLSNTFFNFTERQPIIYYYARLASWLASAWMPHWRPGLDQLPSL